MKNEHKSDHLVIARNMGDNLCVLFDGTRYDCEKYIKTRIRNNQPTHFCHIIKNTHRSLKRLKNKLGISESDKIYIH
jgi:hypothetical protein